MMKTMALKGLKFILSGVLIGLASCFLRYLVISVDLFTGLKSGPGPLFMLVLLITAALIKYVSDLFPMIRGSGVPQLKGVMSGRLIMNPKVELPLKYAAITLLNGLGLSVGSAGPSVQIGAYMGQLFNWEKHDVEFMLICGVAALSVFLGAPMAAMALSFEEFRMKPQLDNMTKLLLVMLGANMMRLYFFGLKPLINFQIETFPQMRGMLILVVSSIILGICFKYLLQLIGKRFQWKILIIVPFLLTFYINDKMPQILGGGIQLFSFLEEHGQSMIMGFALAILFSKLAFTLICVGSGIPAGLFLPVISIGGILGSSIALFSVQFLNETLAAFNTYVVFGIALLFTSVMRLPVTAALLALELTGSYTLAPYLVLIAIGTDYFLEKIGDRPLNEVLLEKLLDIDKTIDY